MPGVLVRVVLELTRFIAIDSLIIILPLLCSYFFPPDMRIVIYDGALGSILIRKEEAFEQPRQWESVLYKYSAQAMTRTVVGIVDRLWQPVLTQP